MLNGKKVEKLLDLIGAVKPSHLNAFIEEAELNLDEYEMWEILWELYRVLEKC